MNSPQDPPLVGRADGLDERLALVDKLSSSPPIVHYMSHEDMLGGQLTGVWSTEEACYRFMATRCPPGSRTAETGSGVSTILFAGWGAKHLCITPGQEEADAILEYCNANGIPTGDLEFDIAPSDEALTRPSPGAEQLDMFLIDGGHGFPAPIIDWYFGASRLRRGGLLVVDDLQLPAVRLLEDFLEADPSWTRVAGSQKWAAYERGSEGSLLQDWYLQPFYRHPRDGTRPVGKVEASLRRRLGPAVRSLRGGIGLSRDR